ncbi:MAG: hypothetical protein Q7T78_17795 [Rhodoferax sp.]|nr:hypothetical protein [Rhodoferax sp.]
MKPPAGTHCLTVALSAALLGAASVHAAVALRGTAELMEALKSQPPCCVIDARSEENQRTHPLADALRYRPGLQIIPTASVIVVADRDQEAMNIGAILLKQHPGKAIYAVKGGVATWEFVRKSLEKVSSSQAPGAAPGISFVIPHNTCETGTPLQILQSKPKP